MLPIIYAKLIEFSKNKYTIICLFKIVNSVKLFNHPIILCMFLPRIMTLNLSARKQHPVPVFSTFVIDSTELLALPKLS